jgi:DNA modification methylase
METIANQIIHGDALEVLKTWPDNCVDAVVTDPPYGLKFMGKRWDYDVPSVELWQEVLRVMKAGAHLLCFCGTRTQHRMAVNIEDAGFEMRDIIAWVYGGGFPKSLDVSKAIDKAAGAKREVVGQRVYGDGHIQNSTKLSPPIGTFERTQDERLETAPATPEAQQWSGWGTALKPSMELITLARKPLIGTVAENVLKHGTGGLNVDECRVGAESRTYDLKGGENLNKLSRQNGNDRDDAKGCGAYGIGAKQVSIGTATVTGRFPANLIHDGSDEVLALFPESNGSGPARKLNRSAKPEQKGWGMNRKSPDYAELPDAGKGRAARFFYTAKASPSERGGENTHPTVKPITLIKYLLKLITPPGGTVLDCFAGSGTTAIAAHDLGFKWVLIERDSHYIEQIIIPRIKRETAQLNMFPFLNQKNQ